MSFADAAPLLVDDDSAWGVLVRGVAAVVSRGQHVVLRLPAAPTVLIRRMHVVPSASTRAGFTASTASDCARCTILRSMVAHSPSLTPVFRGMYVGLDVSKSDVGNGTGRGPELLSTTVPARGRGFLGFGFVDGEEDRFGGCWYGALPAAFCGTMTRSVLSQNRADATLPTNLDACLTPRQPQQKRSRRPDKKCTNKQPAYPGVRAPARIAP